MHSFVRLGVYPPTVSDQPGQTLHVALVLVYVDDDALLTQPAGHPTKVEKWCGGRIG